MSNQNCFLLNVIATQSSTLPNADIVTKLIHKIFLLSRHEMADVALAVSRVRGIVESMGIPMHDSIVKKAMQLASELAEEGRYNLVVQGGHPFVTVCVAIDDGRVRRVVGEFDQFVDGDDEFEMKVGK